MKRNLDEGSVTPTMTVSNESLQTHVESLLKLEGARVLFGGAPITQDKTSKFNKTFFKTNLQKST
jgi:methanogenic corrinoid protein MtbC1